MSADINIVNYNFICYNITITYTQTQPPTIPSGEEMYRMIMSQIEPDLLLENRALLKEKYKAETIEQTQSRAKRYKEAFTRYRKYYDAYTIKMTEDVGGYLKKDLARLENTSKAHEEIVMKNIEESILSA